MSSLPFAFYHRVVMTFEMDSQGESSSKWNGFPFQMGSNGFFLFSVLSSYGSWSSKQNRTEQPSLSERNSPRGSALVLAIKQWILFHCLGVFLWFYAPR